VKERFVCGGNEAVARGFRGVPIGGAPASRPCRGGFDGGARSPRSRRRGRSLWKSTSPLQRTKQRRAVRPTPLVRHIATAARTGACGFLTSNERPRSPPAGQAAMVDLQAKPTVPVPAAARDDPDGPRAAGRPCRRQVPGDGAAWNMARETGRARGGWPPALPMSRAAGQSRDGGCLRRAHEAGHTPKLVNYCHRSTMNCGGNSALGTRGDASRSGPGHPVSPRATGGTTAPGVPAAHPAPEPAVKILAWMPLQGPFGVLGGVSRIGERNMNRWGGRRHEWPCRDRPLGRAVDESGRRRPGWTALCGLVSRLEVSGREAVP
jgi:hypothetical protein